jgi:hypothetical protein
VFHVNSFDLAGVGPAPFLNGIYFHLIVERAGESEPVSENLRHQLPIRFLLSAIGQSIKLIQTPAQPIGFQQIAGLIV